MVLEALDDVNINARDVSRLPATRCSVCLWERERVCLCVCVLHYLLLFIVSNL